MLRAGLLLCALCSQWAHELFPVSARPGASSGSADTSPDAAAVLESHIMRPLLEAAQDYSTDDRCCLLHLL